MDVSVIIFVCIMCAYVCTSVCYATSLNQAILGIEMKWETCLGRPEWRSTAKRALDLLNLVRQRQPKSSVYELEKVSERVRD